MARCALVGIALAIGVASGGVGFVYSGRADVSALSPHWRATSWALSTAMEHAVRRRAALLDPPDDVADADRLKRGAVSFDAMCSGCHGAPGVEPDAAGKGLYPAPPDLIERAADWSVAELFWITKNGVRMTGMPAFGPTHDDETLWEIAGFVTRLPGLSPSAYRALAATTEVRSHRHSH
ncbi:MAG TPA: cytochrome c [Myxococcota bacterium]|jgi:mono/diheme cytochrome c family protein|nr:cytochrome c [Myxococcota bacterium]